MIDWQPELTLKTYDGEILAGYNPEHVLRFGPYWVDPNEVLDVYKAFLTGAPEVPFKTQGGAFLGDSIDLKVYLDCSRHVVFFGDLQLPVGEFNKFVSYAFLGNLGKVHTRVGGSYTTISPDMQKTLADLLLTGLQ